MESFKDEAIGNNYKFKLVKAVCVEAMYSGFLLDVVERAVSVAVGSEHIRTTLLIRYWPGLNSYPGEFPFYTKSPEFDCSLANDAVCDVDNLQRGPLIVSASNEFIKSLNFSGPFIGVHFRIEWILLRKHNVDQCLEKSANIIQDMMRKYNMTSENVIAINDYSDYGSSSCAVGPRSKCVAVKK